MSSETCIIVTGNPIDGAEFVGPFPSVAEASEYAERFVGCEYWIASVDPPAMETSSSVNRKVASGELESSGDTKLLDALEQAERVIRWAAQESEGKVRREIVGGWRHHAAQLRALIDSIKAVA